MKRRHVMVFVTAAGLAACTSHNDELDQELAQEETDEAELSDEAAANHEAAHDEATLQADEPANFQKLVAELLADNNMSPPSHHIAAESESVPASSQAALVPEPALAASAAGGENLWVFVARARVYGAASDEHPRAERLAYGTKVAALQEAEGWVQIGAQRFLKRQDLTDRKARFDPHGGALKAGQSRPSSAPKKLSAAGASSLASGTRRVKSEFLAIRSAPHLEAKVIGYLSNQDEVRALAQGWDGWTQIGPKRFVRTKYLYAPNREVLGSGPSAFTVTTEALYIRTEPDHHATIVGVLLAGDEIRAHAISERWVQLDARRFVRKKHLAPTFAP